MIEWLEHYSLISEHWGWIGAAWGVLSDPPSWLTLGAVVLGGILVWVDIKRDRRRQPAPSAINDIPATPNLTHPKNETVESIQSQERRRNIVDECRKLVSAFMSQDFIPGNDFRLTQILESNSAYYAIRPFLSEKYMARYHMAGTAAYLPSENTLLPVLATEFLDEIDRLELEWGLR